MDITKLATQLIQQQFQGNVSEQGASSALSALFGGNLDIGSLVSKMASNGGLGNIVNSWLGDGDNESVAPSQLAGIFGSDKISEFSSKLGVSTEDATSGLSQIIPQLIDKSSSGGNLLESVGGLGGALNFAKKFL